MSEILGLLRQAAEALASLHGHGLAHGDLKPSNLMLEADGRLRVLDFGLATAIDATQTQGVWQPGEVLGTPAFMAPERLQGAPPSPAGDIYALGLIGQALLGEGDEDVTQRLDHESGTDVDADGHHVRRALLELLARMTRRAPSQRLPSMLIAASDCERLLRRLRVEAMAQPAAAVPRHRFGAVAMLLLLTLLLSVAGGIAMLTFDAGASVAEVPAVPALPPLKALQAAETLLDNFAQEGAIDEAIAHLEGLSGAQRLRAPAAALLAIGYCLRYANDARDPLWLQRAEVQAELAVAADDQLALARAAQAWVLEFHGETEAAEDAYGHALALDPSNPQALGGLARLLVAQQRYAEADAVLADALQRHPLQRRFWDALGSLRFRQADYGAAEAAFRHSIAIAPDSVYAYANLNAALLRQDRGDEAMAVLQQGLKLRPHSRLYSNLGTTLYARGRYAEAASAFEAALSDQRGSPNDYLKWANLADALRWLPERRTEAQVAYARALQLIEPLLREGNGDALRYSRAALYAARLGRREQAERYLAQAQPAGAGDADLSFRALLVAEAMQRRDTALAHLETALRLGYPRHLIEAEPELLELRRDTRFHHILSRSAL